MKRLKRLARYLLEVPVGIIFFDAWSKEIDNVKVFVDSDWAGCKSTRASTSGGIVSWGGSVLKSWSRTQKSIALSSGEAEVYAALKGCAEGIGIKSLMADLGIIVDIEVVQDSTAAKGTASRIGIGKIKHLDVGWLWIQEAVKSRLIKLVKIDGKENPSDILTKPISALEASRVLKCVGFELRRR